MPFIPRCAGRQRPASHANRSRCQVLLDLSGSGPSRRIKWSCTPMAASTKESPSPTTDYPTSHTWTTLYSDVNKLPIESYEMLLVNGSGSRRPRQIRKTSHALSTGCLCANGSKSREPWDLPVPQAATSSFLASSHGRPVPVTSPSEVNATAVVSAALPQRYVLRRGIGRLNKSRPAPMMWKCLILRRDLCLEGHKSLQSVNARSQPRSA